ncbi:hypothetical protein B0H17DRAFT_1124000 [Mycena rosella]|uniref:Uncharacterized protein n=1 Tax=Mycena rosella TaxID=1033263 RepID=A0AAD7H2W6_MYCRO|nr:hypothetical protein B0H17DRAFT_1124000 [Mycena rosella]
MPPQCRLSAASVPPQCRLSAASIRDSCEVCLDVNVKSLKLLEKVQCKFLRRMLELKDSTRPAYSALQESLTLGCAGKISWVTDLCIVLSRLNIPVTLDIAEELDVPAVESAMKAVKNSMESWIKNKIEMLSRTKDLLAGRLEIDKETGKLVKKSLDFRHYLRVKTADHRPMVLQWSTGDEKRDYDDCDQSDTEFQLEPSSNGSRIQDEYARYRTQMPGSGEIQGYPRVENSPS